jgi:hypothetical protein
MVDELPKVGVDGRHVGIADGFLGVDVCHAEAERNQMARRIGGFDEHVPRITLQRGKHVPERMLDRGQGFIERGLQGGRIRLRLHGAGDGGVRPDPDVAAANHFSV